MSLKVTHLTNAEETRLNKYSERTPTFPLLGTKVQNIQKNMLQILEWTVGVPAKADEVDVAFDADSNTNAQPKRLGENVIPKFAEVVSAQVICTETVAGAPTNFNVELGTSTGGDQLLSEEDLKAADDIAATAAGDSPLIAANDSAADVWIEGDVDTHDWEDLTAGKWVVRVAYIDFGA